MSESIHVHVHPLAAAEIDEADDWYFDKDPDVAAKFRQSVIAALVRIGAAPFVVRVPDRPRRIVRLLCQRYVSHFVKAGRLCHQREMGIE